jgi:hypothetical protein
VRQPRKRQKEPLLSDWRSVLKKYLTGAAGMVIALGNVEEEEPKMRR